MTVQERVELRDLYFPDVECFECPELKCTKDWEAYGSTTVSREGLRCEQTDEGLADCLILNNVMQEA